MGLARYYPASDFGRVAGQTHNVTLYDLMDAGYDLGLADWPMWEPNTYPPGIADGDKKAAWRKYVNDRLIEHFLFREIGCETPTQFVFYLNRRLRERMPSIGPVFSALEGIDGEGLRRSGLHTSASEASQESTSDSKSDSYTSTNPKQTMLGHDPTEYYDAGTHSASASTGGGSSSASGTDTTFGGYVTDATNRWFAGVNNALDLVFDAVEPCFSHIWRDHFNAF